VSRFVDGLVPVRLGAGYRWLLASSWTTNLGDGAAVAAGPLLVASLTGDPFLISLAALLRWAPPLVFGLYAGVLSDRLDRRRIVIAADGLRAVVLSFLIITMVTGTATSRSPTPGCRQDSSPSTNWSDHRSGRPCSPPAGRGRS
jgi:MFS family permease